MEDKEQEALVGRKITEFCEKYSKEYKEAISILRELSNKLLREVPEFAGRLDDPSDIFGVMGCFYVDEENRLIEAGVPEELLSEEEDDG